MRVAFCELNSPRLPEVLTPGAVVTPFLLVDAYHARLDIPRQIAGFADVRQAEVLGEDPRLVTVLREGLNEIGVCGPDPNVGVVVVAIGSSNVAANARTASVALRLASGADWAGATTAFATGPGPRLPAAVEALRRNGAQRLVIAPWFLAPGRLLDRVSKYARGEDIPMAAPLGAHQLVAATVLDRYDAALAESMAA